jgi:hypothetical protein
VPVLARTFEERGIATVVVTMMPVWSERLGVPRTLAVDHPYGQPMGPAGDRARQSEVFAAALDALERADAPRYVADSPFPWPDPDRARRAWHPPEPSPIVKAALERRRAGRA